MMLVDTIRQGQKVNRTLHRVACMRVIQLKCQKVARRNRISTPF